MAAQSAEFKQALEDVKTLPKMPNQSRSQKLYGLYKVAIGADISKVPAPKFYELEAKAKLSAWQRVLDRGETPEQAQAKYTEFVRRLLEETKKTTEAEKKEVMGNEDEF